MKNNPEYRDILSLCLLFICFFIPPPYFAHFPHGHGFKSFFNLDTQQQYQLSGTVTDSYGPMPGVHVLIKGTNTGTFTDPNGGYSLLVNNKDILVFSYLGYHSRELPVLGRTTLDVEMQSEVTELQEVEVNAGYYTVKERERTGSISRVTAKEIELQPVVNPLQALQGRMPGVEIIQPSGVSGLAASIRIRGRNSLRFEGDYPLFIVDGVPVNSSPISSINPFASSSGIDPLNTLNLSNIQSIEVLKDADATAIYGSRGANGVVLISTKKGTGNKGKTSLDVKFYSGLPSVSNRMQLLNTAEYIRVRTEAFENDGITPTETRAPDLVLWDQNRNTDWQDVLLGGTSTISDLNMSVSGGNDNTTYVLGGSYHKEGTVFPGDSGYKKISANFNLNHSSTDRKFHINFSTNYGVDNNKLFFGTNYVHSALTLPPNAPELYNSEGGLNWENGTWTNPLATLYAPQTIQTDNILSNLSISYELLLGLRFKANLGYSNLNSEDKTRNLMDSYDPDTWDRVTLTSYHSFTKRKSWILEPQLTYNRGFKKLNLDVLGGLTIQNNQNSKLSMEGSGYSDDSVVGNLEAADEVRVSNNENISYKYAAIFGRLGINWDRKYFLNLTGRRDGSSKFGPGKRFANFWAIGGAWIFAGQRALKNSPSFLSFGKIRSSYGTTGSDQIPDYGYMDTYEPTLGPGGLYPTQLYNPDYSWEINKKLEASIQLGFFKDRVNVDLSWYRNRSSNQLVGYPLPSITGFTSVQANLPALIENTGWELALSTLNFQAKNFSWRTSLNLTFPSNKLLKFDNLDLSPYRFTYKIGEPLDVAFLYKYSGIDPTNGRYSITDVNEDGRYDFEDQTVIRNMGRKYYGGIQNTINIKKFNLSFFMEYVKQDSYLSDLTITPGRFGNNTTQVLDPWRQEGDNPKVQKLSQSITSFLAYNRVLNSDLFVGDASFLRLRTLSLSYQLPNRILSHIKVNTCTLFAHAQNLFTITNFKGLDPQGGKVVPPLRTITCGIQLKL
ncbi:SusC/RagA family TonB-linked outer membrane protein [Arenibacter sp. M-2]|uniref:SusC/RagA family TonB-linked outer membrane protein n=1 Tax=Arenibacter sp. M-2 TaxID=3053612 RepID=UPI002570978A|nr:SusC/RagA family TonB-linked outer membrane protein [Arenibacter sp. M-2]MDL5513243.1 SusC/RagA family TonB-linked outer membrane protein [Arenibacter sp. M-2]